MMLLTDADMPIRQGELSYYQGHMDNTITNQRLPFHLPFARPLCIKMNSLDLVLDTA